jgi:uncharacterized protein (DUF1330 family)
LPRPYKTLNISGFQVLAGYGFAGSQAKGEATMAAYVVVDCDVMDPVRFENYRKLAPPTIAEYGGRYLARGGAMDVLEGDWQPSRLVLLEFPTADAARRWYDSAGYGAARAERAGAARMNMVVVEGV